MRLCSAPKNINIDGNWLDKAVGLESSNITGQISTGCETQLFGSKQVKGSNKCKIVVVKCFVIGGAINVSGRVRQTGARYHSGQS